MDTIADINALTPEQELQDFFLMDTLEPCEIPGQVEMSALPVEAGGELVEADFKQASFSSDPTKKVNAWDPRLIIDLNLGLDPLEDILLRYNLTPAQLETLNNNPVFRKDLNITAREMREGGVSFARKAATQAESYLEVLDEIVNDARVPASTRLAGIKDVVKWGGLEPKDEKEKGNGGGGGVQIQINF